MAAFDFLELPVLPTGECVQLGTLLVDEASLLLHANRVPAINRRESSVDWYLLAHEFGKADTQMIDVRVSSHARSSIGYTPDYALGRSAFRHLLLKVCQRLDEEDRSEVDPIEVTKQAGFVNIQQLQRRLVGRSLSAQRSYCSC